MGGPPGMSGEPALPQMQLGQKKGAKKEELPKIIDDNNGKILWRSLINKTY